MIVARELCKSYSPSLQAHDDALQSIHFDACPGSITCLFGHNGSGKSTLLSLLAGQSERYRGSLQVNGHAAPDHVRHLPISYAPEQPSYPDHWSVQQVLSFAGHLQNLPVARRIDQQNLLLRDFALEPLADSPIPKLSHGQLQRVNLAQSLMGQPTLILWDEPTSGLDWIHRDIVLTRLIEFRKLGACIVISTHDLSLLHLLADQVIHLHKGTSRYIGPLQGWRSHLMLQPVPGEASLLTSLPQ